MLLWLPAVSFLALHHAPLVIHRGTTAPRTASQLAPPVAAMGPVMSAATAEREKIYTKKDPPPVLGGLRIGTRRLVIVTGASSGLGLATTKALCANKDYFVIAAVRDPAKMDRVAQEAGISKNNYFAMKLELASLQSVRDFVDNLKLYIPARPPTHLICNAAVYRPTEPDPIFTDDGHEMSMGVNHLGHFLLVQLLLPELRRAKGARCCIVGSITGNSNTIGGGFVYPRADLGDLDGLKQGPGSEMVDGGSFDGAKAYKDAKALNMMTVLELHRRYHEETGVVFSSMYPGCIAESNLFREKRSWFRTVFPLFMKYVTGGYVSEDEAGERLAQCITDPKCDKSGVYWSWNGNAQQVGLAKATKGEDGKTKWEVAGAGGSGGDIFENQFSGMITDEIRGRMAYDYSLEQVKDFL